MRVDLGGLELEADAEVVDHRLYFILGGLTWAGVFCTGRVEREGLELDDVANSREVGVRGTTKVTRLVIAAKMLFEKTVMDSTFFI